MSSTTSKITKLYGMSRALRGGANRFEKSPSEYNAKMNSLSNSIFGEYQMPIETKNNKKLHYSLIQRPLYDRPEIVKYYPANEETFELYKRLRNYGLYRDEAQDFKEEMERLRNLRGKYKIGYRRMILESKGEVYGHAPQKARAKKRKEKEAKLAKEAAAKAAADAKK